MKTIHKILNTILLVTLTFCFSCKEEVYEFGQITPPSNISINTEIAGVDSENPHGDGSGVVTYTAQAENAISYKFAYNGEEHVAPSGKHIVTFSETGLTTYTVTAIAIGTGGVTSSKSTQTEVLVTYAPPADLLALLTGDGERTWRIKNESNGHFGLGPVGGEIPSEWFAAPANDKASTGMYDDRMTFNIDGTFTYDTGEDGTIFGKQVPLEADFGPPSNGDTPNDNAEYENYPLANQTESWALTAPGGKETINLTGKAFFSYYVGGNHKYEIFQRSNSEIILRTTDWNNEFDWWITLVPVDGDSPQEPGDGDIFDELVWSDEFNTPGSLDPAKWNYDLGTGSNGWGNNEVQVYTNDAKNVKIVDNGTESVLKITAIKENGGYTSARVKTQDKYSFTYGKIEVRAKLPGTGGTWPAIWMLGDNITTVGWPACGEIDIMEHVGNRTGFTSSAIHNTAGHGGTYFGDEQEIPTATSDFHIYTAVWTEEKIEFSVDGNIHFTYNPSAKNGDNWPFDANQFMIFNIAVGGTLGGAIDPSFSEDSMEIDYVRVYQ